MSRKKEPGDKKNLREILISPEIAQTSRSAFISILEGISKKINEPLTNDEIEQVIIACIGVLVYCRGFFVPKTPEASDKFQNFIKQVMDQIAVYPEQEGESP